MLQQTPKSSGLFARIRKLHMDFRAKPSICCDMAKIDDEVDPIKVRCALFALITARLEDAHMFAVTGQAKDLNAADTRNCITDIRSILDKVQIQLDPGGSMG
tara:strand:+ start:2701 stop:3006 length:306 start_codon:yes stop_codon:yes gene_type:complete